ncbi:MAG: imidazoleglycerol-phosphate dehydratase HisB [Desulfobacterales bacterium]|jgi:imidazoleglycerol-phosphate dehydratase
MQRTATVHRQTKETDIRMVLSLDGAGAADITTGIAFFDHMLNLLTVHGLFDLTVEALGDLEVDFHHTVEDVGLVFGEALERALGDRKGIRRYGHAAVPMDEVLTAATIDLSRRPYLVFSVPEGHLPGAPFDTTLAKEFFRALASRGGLNLHINVFYGENEHHIIESMFKAVGRALDEATAFDPRRGGVASTKGSL